MPGAGWELQINRLRQDPVPGQTYKRTASTYKVFHDGHATPLAGWLAERGGPGDNTEVGREQHLRIAVGTYELSTHDADGNDRFKTIGYTPSTKVAAESMPCIRLLETGARAGILIHPAAGYVWSIGCLNPAANLSTPKSTIAWVDSRRRVIALLDDLKSFLGTQFPTQNNRKIPRARVVITGEPV